MTPDTLEAHCLSLPGAHLVIQWMDSRVYKVDAKMFAVMGSEGSGVTLKCESEDTARMLIEAGVARVASHLKRGGWVFIALGDMPEEELKTRPTRSYALVRQTLTKAKQAALPPFEGG